MSSFPLTPGAIATLACCLEVSAPKPGNVHRGADFEDAKLEDFLSSGVLLGQIIDQQQDATLGQTILVAVNATMDAVGTNTNLGIILLLVPLAKAMQRSAMRRSSMKNEIRLSEDSVIEVFDQLVQNDATFVYQAIRIANPGGLGDVEKADVRREGTESEIDLMQAMELAADIDLVARQYVRRYHDLFTDYLPVFKQSRQTFSTLAEAIVYLHLYLMARDPDSLIWRKCGEKLARQSQTMAAKIIDSYPLKIFEASAASAVTSSALINENNYDNDGSHPEKYWKEVADFDFWLRSDGHRRNPGTTADLVTATLFAGIARGDLRPPFR